MKLKTLAALCVVGAMTLGGAVSAYAAENRRITVNGQGVVTATPDIATVNLGVNIKDADAQTAQTKNTAVTNEVLAVLKNLGIADKDVQTSYFSVYPDYDNVRMGFERDEPEITGYTVTNSLSVTIRDLSIVGTVLERSIAAGANYGGGISFGLSDSTEYYERALTLAIENARSKGAAIAKAVGVTIGAPSEISEQGGYYASTAYSGFANNMSMKDAIPVQQGTLNVTASVMVTYEY